MLNPPCNGKDARWHDQSLSSPASGPTSRWRSSPRNAASGADGLELACWGDHFDVDAALADEGYCDSKRELLERHGLECWAIGTPLVGQAVCDPIDSRHQGCWRRTFGATATRRGAASARPRR